jgi:signal transduction histidine kinase
MSRDDREKPGTRTRTDASLQAERDRADLERSGRLDRAEGEAADLVQTARDRADRVLEAARTREDERSGAPTERVRGERRTEDAVIREARDLADATLAAERVRGQAALAGLLLSERHETDQSLLMERARTDDLLGRRDDFVAMLGHDLRSLLGAIALATQLLQEHVHDPAVVARTAGSIQRATAQMTRLVADLLDVASIDAGKLVLILARHDVGEVVRHAVASFAPLAAAKRISLSVDDPGQVLWSDFDPDRIAQVLANLLSNAVKFTRPGGSITVGWARRGSDHCCFVADSGEGIAEDRLETIFERYTQIATTDRRGLGLGLYISRRIIEAHHGQLWAESALGRGSTFWFTLPLLAVD